MRWSYMRDRIVSLQYVQLVGLRPKEREIIIKERERERERQISKLVVQFAANWTEWIIMNYTNGSFFRVANGKPATSTNDPQIYVCFALLCFVLYSSCITSDYSFCNWSNCAIVCVCLCLTLNTLECLYSIMVLLYNWIELNRIELVGRSVCFVCFRNFASKHFGPKQCTCGCQSSACLSLLFFIYYYFSFFLGYKS